MFNLKKYVFLLLIAIIPLVSSMDIKNNIEDKIEEKYKKLVDPQVFDQGSINHVEEFCASLKKHILLPNILEDLYKSYEDMEWYRYIEKKEAFYYVNDNQNGKKNEKAKYQLALDLRFNLHNKRIELFVLSKTMKDK